MRIASQATDLRSTGQPICAAIGIFDGVHLGHQALLQLALHNARQSNALAAAITFDRHPNSVLAPDRTPPLIQPLRQRLATLQRLGLDATLVLPFTPEFSRLPPDTFIRSLAADLGALRFLCVGQGFSFGRDRQGNVALLHTLGATLHFKVHALPPVSLDNTPVRSTRIRDLIRAGDLPGAARLLGRPYAIAGTVVRGDAIGRTLGFPTANLDVAGLVLPPHGVYTARVHSAHTTHPAVLNLGLRPTLDQPRPSLHCEVHLLDGHPDLYGQDLEVEIVDRIRDEQRFPSLDALRAQIARDVNNARRRFNLPAS